jgi:hypothetical protein
MRIRHLIPLTILGLVCAPHSGFADDQAEGTAIVDKAVKAMGGADKLVKHKGVGCQFKGKVDADGMEVELKLTGSIQGTDRWKLDVEISIGGQAQTGTLVLNGDKAWGKEGVTGKVDAIQDEAREFLRADFYALGLALNPSLLLARDFQLSPLGEAKVDDRSAVGVRISRKDRPDVSLYFDKEKGMPVKCELQVKEADKQEKTHEFRFSGSKEAGGIKYFGKLVMKRDGKTTIEGDVTDHKPVEGFEESTFDKP